MNCNSNYTYSGNLERASSIELLKILAILLIVISHVVQTLGDLGADFGINLAANTWDFQSLTLSALRYSGCLGNTVFFICSAWFLLDSKGFKPKKFFQMLLDIWLVSVLILVVVFFLKSGNLHVKEIIKSFFPTFFANNWYMTSYLLFYAFHPYLNKIIYGSSRTSLFRLSAISGALYIVINFTGFGAFFSSGLIQWFVIYFVMAYMRLYMKEFVDNKKKNIVLLLVGLIGNVALILFTNVLGLYIPFDKFSNQLLRWNSNINVFLICAAIGALNLARNFHFSSKWINYVSGLSMLIYIIHENLLLRMYYRPQMWQYIYTNYGFQHILMWTAVMVIIVFSFGLLSAILYKESFQRITKNVVEKIVRHFSVKCNQLENALISSLK